MTKDQNNDRLKDMTDVIDLLKNGAAIAELWQYMQRTVASSADKSLPLQLAESLNAWLRKQDPKDPKQQLPLKEKRAVAELVELLMTVAHCNLMLDSEPCRFDVAVDPNHPEGSFRIRAIGEGRAKIRRARLTDLLDTTPLMFEEINLKEASESQDPVTYEQEELSRKAKNKQGKKAK